MIDMKKFEFDSIRTNLTFWFLTLALSPLLIGMVFTYWESSRAFQEKTFEKLTAIRDLKVGQVETWIAERKSDFSTFAHNTDKTLLNDALNSNDSKSSENKSKKQIRDRLLNYQKNYLVYQEIFIVNSKTGLVEISTNSSNEGLYKKNETAYTGAIMADKIFIGDVYYSASIGKHLLSFSVPLNDSWDEIPKTIGVLVANVDLTNSLSPMLLNRIGLGETGETLIVDKNLMAINDLRWYDHAPLQLKINAEPAVRAAQGKTGIFISNDYRGKKVIAAYTYIPETGWGFVCKQDWSELNQATSSMGQFLITLLIFSGLLIIVIVHFVSKTISSPIIALNADSKKIADGDYSIRNTVKLKNELGKLGESINTMVQGIESKANIQKGVMAISKAVIGHASRMRYSNQLLSYLSKVTDAQMAVLYTLNEQELLFEHFDSIGANKNLMQPFMSGKPEGELGNAVESKKIQHLQKLSDDTKFTYRTSAGEIIPKEIITIPILNNDSEVVALISLAKINGFSHEATETIQLSWNTINSSYSNLLAGEQTAVLAENLMLSNQKLEAQSEELQQQAEELRQQTDELQKGSDELLLQNHELEMQRKQVEEATRMKSEFLSNMSHELRTPLNSINALSRVLINQANSRLTDDENEYLEVVERNGKRLLLLINDILDLSKIEAGKMELQPNNVSILRIMTEIAENIRPLAKHKNISLDLSMPNEEIELETDENRLNQILTNIIGNAVKFTDKGGVRVSVQSDSTVAYIQVKDTGIGISKEMLPEIFKEFRQVDGSTSRSYEGTGLGLAIVKNLVNALHGEITVTSTPGEGSVFTVSLPLKWKGNPEKGDLQWMHPDIPSDTRKTILVVDDDPKIVRQISDSLKESGYHIIATTSGIEALRLAQKHKPIAITLDIVMPDLDGWEVLQQLKTNPETTNIPVIIISISDEKQTGIALGAVGYITKPVNRQLLLREIKKWTASASSIMIVDDNPIDREQIAGLLRLEQIDVLQAESGVQCLEMLQYQRPDLLVLDLMMPEMDGFQVLNEIRSRPETSDLPIIVVTAKDLTEKDKKLLSGKVSLVLTKSAVALPQIYDEIKRILERIRGEMSDNQDIRPTKQTRHILMIEDNEISVIQVQKILEKEGFAVDVAKDGKQALDFVKHTVPDGIILDLMMPEMDGFEVLEKIRGRQETRMIPILILTAKNLTNSDLSRLSANNVQQLVQKGDVNAMELLGKVKQMMGIETDQTRKVDHHKEVDVRPIMISGKETGKVSAGRKKILVVEDSADNRLTTRAILGEQYDLVDAIDGEDGLEKARLEIPDLILLDFYLPKMNGFKVIKLLKENENTKYIPVIAVTARAMKNDREEILEAGCDGYVSKPIDANLLLEEIEKLLGS
ncbi:MAG: hypothetical protein CVT99_00305 [Bacteroidetes bacterium HGW-Bacteroidetes-16]|jgi:CheY-like chemotaxis protein/HAMP domain-containing protein|nr:MAG: hypothetical protein CVT99_00305 [Bacteroidetes bacterium HGW-Bacteroidetes-16]